MGNPILPNYVGRDIDGEWGMFRRIVPRLQLGGADDTQAMLEACRSDGSGAGVVVELPAGVIRVRQMPVFSGSPTASPKPVYLRGQGMYATTLQWDPITLSDHCIRYQAGAGADAYTGGGVCDLAISCSNPLATGSGIYASDGYFQTFANVLVTGFLGSGGRGYRQDGPVSVPQHIQLNNVHLRANSVNLQWDKGQACDTDGLVLNQPGSGINAVFTEGTLNFDGGTVQSGTFEIRPVSQNSAFVKFDGTWFESASVPGVQGFLPTGGGTYGGRIIVLNPKAQGSHSALIQANGYDVRIDEVQGSGYTKLVNLTGCTVIGVHCPVNTGLYTLDATSQLNGSWINGGKTSVNTLGPQTPP